MAKNAKKQHKIAKKFGENLKKLSQKGEKRVTKKGRKWCQLVKMAKGNQTGKKLQ